ncbi:MAG: response regulator transcription factor [Opitutaceae bacterium]|nr:response regulator transcription factor [Opitutaceae bacterium]
MRILIVEDQTMFRELLAAACAQVVEQADLRLAADGAAALVACRSCAPDLVVLDLELPDIDGLDLLGELRMLAPRLRVIVLSSHTDEFSLHRATLAQVNGFVDKDGQPVVILAEAIREVSAGRQYLSPIVHQVKLAMRNDPAAFNKVLTDREVEMLALIGAGAPDDEIAARFSLRPITVKNHRRNILSKLGLHSTPDLMRYALEKGFVRIRRRRPPAVAPAP